MENQNNDIKNHICDQYEKRKTIMRNYINKRYHNDTEYREKCNAESKRRYQENKLKKKKPPPKKVNEYQKQYRLKNKEAIREYQDKYRLKKKEAQKQALLKGEAK